MKKRHKRYLATFLSMILLVSGLVSCKSGNNNNSDSSSDDDSLGQGGSIYTVDFHFENVDYPKPETQQVMAGDFAVNPDVPVFEDSIFLGWFQEGYTAYPYDFSKPVLSDMALSGVFYSRNFSDDDSDVDGLPDALETILATGADNYDTDGDGLSDGMEYLCLHLDPLNPDTDGNGVLDSQEDTDNDGLTNAEEIKNGTSPEYEDSDFDDLSDAQELREYNSDPMKADTDDDGVLDGTEVSIGTDPVSKDTSFETTWENEEVSAENPVSIEVKATTDAFGAGTLTVHRITSTNIPALTSSSVGYLAPAYEIQTEGELENATISVFYDESLSEDSEEFDPVLYWYNEDESELIEVPGQVRENGRITAQVEHFSIYGIFNRVLIDGVSIPLSILPDGTLADKNNDRLPDEVARLLNEGTLLYDNTALLIGVTDMYGDSDDWDDDGLKNGEEIESAVSLTGNLKILIHSNPLIADSDGDGVNDYREVKELGTSPMRTNRTPVGAKNSLMSNGKYSYEISKQAWENDVALFLDWNKQEKAKQLLINYLYDYAPQDTSANAEAISRIQEYEDCINFVVLVSNLMKVGKNAVDLYGNVSDLSKTRNISIYTDGKDLKKDMIDAINKKEFDAVKDAWSTSDLSLKVEEISIELDTDDLFKNVKDAANLSSAAAKAVKLYRSSKTAYDMSFVNSYTVYYSAAKDSALKTAKTTLSVAIDVLDYVESYTRIQSTYSKIKANMEAYQRYYDMLIYIKLNAQDAFVRNAAGDLANMVLDTEGEYMKQVSAACDKEAQWATLNVALDLTNKNPYVAIFQTFITLVPITGVNEMVDSTITCRTMKAVSDACVAEISCLVKDEGADSFSYLPSKSSAVYDNLVQLAQSRIMGEYYLYEYCAEDSSMASKINQLIGAVTGGNASPEKYREIGKKKIKGIYDDANRLNLKLSPNLPYYDDFYKELYQNERGNESDTNIDDNDSVILMDERQKRLKQYVDQICEQVMDCTADFTSWDIQMAGYNTGVYWNSETLYDVRFFGCTCVKGIGIGNSLYFVIRGEARGNDMTYGIWERPETDDFENPDILVSPINGFEGIRQMLKELEQTPCPPYEEETLPHEIVYIEDDDYLIKDVEERTYKAIEPLWTYLVERDIMFGYGASSGVVRENESAYDKVRSIAEGAPCAYNYMYFSIDYDSNSYDFKGDLYEFVVIGQMINGEYQCEIYEKGGEISSLSSVRLQGYCDEYAVLVSFEEVFEMVKKLT